MRKHKGSNKKANVIQSYTKDLLFSTFSENHLWFDDLKNPETKAVI